ncbi:MAG: putative transport system ATP-binding protein [Euryarchaeota archaeon]|nr:putative transport system ATP-binding protein [Euryarchaeota archaeon]
MTLTEIIDTLKSNFNLSKVTIAFEKTMSFYNESDNASKENDIGKGLENNPYSDSVGDSVKSFSTVKISQNGVSPFIKLENVWKIYKMGDTEFAALAGINLEINEGEFLVILGPSGSGKSTLMNLIGCLDLPSKGTIYLDSKNIANLAESELARIRGEMIGFIFQSFNLIPTLNTEENVMLPMEFQEVNMNEGRKRAEYLLRIVGLSDKIQNLPSQLSGGQMQRVAIARSLAVNPPIILADEPTGNLDSKTGYYILNFLNDLHKKENKTIIIVTHDVEIVKLATRVVHIKDGQIESIESCTKDNPCELRE